MRRTGRARVLATLAAAATGPSAWLALVALVAAPAATARASASVQEPNERPRAREVGVVVGRLPPGPWNAITDVAGVRVGHVTLSHGDSIRTGITAVLPHGGNLFHEKVRAAIAVGNGFGKLVGLSQVNELGEIETPILLTGTLSVFRAADALLDTLLAIAENREVGSMNPLVGETNDGYLSDIRARPIRPEHVRSALRRAASGPVDEGSVGAGTGTVALGWKGGIGTASRRVDEARGGYTVGVLVQTNYGGDLRIDGLPVARELREARTPRDAEGGVAARFRGGVPPGGPAVGGEVGSVMIVLATDAPLAHRELQRLAYRTFLGIARTGSHMSHGSGDYAIAFSTSRDGATTRDGLLLSSLFQAAAEATEEAVLNSLFRATSVTGFRGRRAEALPVERVVELLRRRGRLGPGRTGG